MDGKSLNITEEKLNKLKDILPEAFSEGKVDWEKLKAALGDDVEFKNERYVLNWAGKSDAFKVLQSPTTATLVPDKEESVDFDNTDNIFIEGENLEVLKVLQKSYFGKIKMIYIDPPYNTGNDTFIYPDKFSETKEEYMSRIGDKDDTGYMTREGLFRKNNKDSGHYHSNWLSMMYPRLFLARNLLKDDGVIFVSIDDNEVHNLRLLMNEVFGEENFLGMFVINASPSAIDYGHMGKMHEYALFYSKNIDNTETNQIPEKDKKFKYEDEQGPFNLYPLYNGNVAFNPETRPNLHYPFYLNTENNFDEDFYEIDLKPHGDNWVEVYPVISEKDGIPRVWRWGKEKSSKNLNEEIIGYKTNSGEYRVVQKTRHTSKMIRSLQLDTSISSRRGTSEVQELFGKKVFSFPKAVELLKRFVIAGSNKNDIILDFFSGVGTLAHAVIDVNREESSERKFICVQLSEKVDDNSEAFREGYNNISDIGKERIRRVIDKIKKEQEGKLDLEGKENQDLGFKVFKLQNSNFKIWRTKIESEEQLVKQLQDHLEPLDENAELEYVLYELLLKSGILLTAKIEEKEGFYLVNDNEIALILNKVDKEIIKAVIEQKPHKVITLDRLFNNNDQLKTNTALQMKDAEIEFKVV